MSKTQKGRLVHLRFGSLGNASRDKRGQSPKPKATTKDKKGWKGAGTHRRVLGGEFGHLKEQRPQA